MSVNATREELGRLVERLKERQSLRYIADCECGHCQQVDVNDLRQAIIFLASLSRRLEPDGGTFKAVPGDDNETLGIA